MPAQRDDLAAALARHFFGADAALQEYAMQSVLTALEDGDSIDELAVSLESFLSPAHGQLELRTALEQLWRAAQQPKTCRQEQEQWPWAQAETRAAEAVTDAAAASPQPVSSAAARSQGLSIEAAEFRPSFVPQPQQQVEVQQAAERLEVLSLKSDEHTARDAASRGLNWTGDAGHNIWGAEQHASAWDEAYAEEQAWSEDARSTWSAGSSASPASSMWLPASPSSSGGSSSWPGFGATRGRMTDHASQAAFVHVLEQQFPFYSAAALRQVFEQQGCNPAATIDMLCSLESEVQGQGVAQRWQQQQQQASAVAAAAPAFDDDDFPTLGASASGGTSQAGAFQGQHGAAPLSQAGYAQVAKSAAWLPERKSSGRSNSRPGQRSPRAAASGQSAKAASGQSAKAAAPIWEARDVQQFETGAAVAEQYAALRARARDQARLRNQCFQQATQAYMAGQRALAKELGAKGRWHSEQMRLAHEEAAAQLFTRRNAAALLGPKAGSGGISTVDLHGLHVAEALDILDWLCEEQRQRRRGSKLRVVVGVGQHSHAARLPQAVRRHLQEQGLAYSEPYAGLLEISL